MHRPRTFQIRSLGVTLESAKKNPQKLPHMILTISWLVCQMLVQEYNQVGRLKNGLMLISVK